MDSAAQPTTDPAVARQWLASNLIDNVQVAPPFSFTYGGRPFAESVGNWRREVSTVVDPDAHVVKHAIAYADPATDLVVRCEAVTYDDFPVVEWTLYFKNGGSTDTPILEKIQVVDTTLASLADEDAVLHHATGSPAMASDYAPLQTTLKPRSALQLATRGGRSSDTVLPYFNIAWRDGGAILALGWPGQWAGEFSRDATAGVHARGGQELTHFVLHPGEEVRGPLVALLFYRGDWLVGQNVWRRWMIAHNLPKPGGQLPPPFLAAASSNQFNEMENANDENQKLFIDRYLAEEIPLDYWWMDAGWYVTETGKWFDTGTWEVDRKRFPGGLRSIVEHAHERRLKCVVWFEPERLAAASWLGRNHPEWLLSVEGGRWKLLDLGNPEAWEWVVEHFDRLIREEAVDLYRQDFNVAPLDYWRANDAPDRQGITEIRHVTGYLAYWDELRRRHPNMLLDTCASGGRRLDLETLRRSVPLHKSDHDYRDHAARQCQAYGIALWIPFHGAPVCKIDQVDPYAFRSAVGMMVGLGFDVRRGDLDYPLLRNLTAEWRRIADYYYGDYYPLTGYSVDQANWLAWQYHRPESGDGVIQAFRRAVSPYVSASFKLRGLDPTATYRLINFDVEGAIEMSGRALLDEGLLLTLSEQPASAIVTYAMVDRQ
jgi:alpha-galactosidase